LRIDRFLHCIRLVKSRTLAQSIIAEGRVRILRVVALPTRRGPASEARACYEELGIDGRDAAS
jgi:ribosome-associated heat shock protein Hsp15